MRTYLFTLKLNIFESSTHLPITICLPLVTTCIAQCGSIPVIVMLMESILILILIVCVVAWFLNSVSSSSLDKDNTIEQKTKTTPRTKTTVFPSKKIHGNPNLVINSFEDEYRFFENYYIDGVKRTFGFPKPNCIDKRVWFGAGDREIERISYPEALQRINATSLVHYLSLRTAASAARKENVMYYSS